MNDITPYVGSIYALVCSCEPEHFRYVGLTTKLLEQRLRGHLEDALDRAQRHRTPKLAWMRKHLELGHAIQIRLIDETARDRQELIDLEIFAMWACRANGHRLTNSSLIAHNTQEMSAATRQKLRDALTGRRISDEHRSNIGAAQKGKRTMSEENKMRLREANLGRALSQEHKDRISHGRKGRAAWNKGVPMDEAAKQKLRSSKLGKPNRGAHTTNHTNRGIIKDGCPFCSGVESA